MPLELFARPITRGPGIFPQSLQGIVNQFCGSTLVASGAANVTVSTAIVKSDAIIAILGTKIATDPTSTNAGPFAVNSIVDGVSWAFTRTNSVPAPYGETINWLVLHTTPFS